MSVAFGAPIGGVLFSLEEASIFLSYSTYDFIHSISSSVILISNHSHLSCRWVIISLWRRCGALSLLHWWRPSPFGPSTRLVTAGWCSSTWSSTPLGTCWSSYPLSCWVFSGESGELSSSVQTLRGVAGVRPRGWVTTLFWRCWLLRRSRLCWRSPTATHVWAPASWSLSCSTIVVCWIPHSCVITPMWALPRAAVMLCLIDQQDKMSTPPCGSSHWPWSSRCSSQWWPSAWRYRVKAPYYLPFFHPSIPFFLSFLYPLFLHFSVFHQSSILPFFLYYIIHPLLPASIHAFIPSFHLSIHHPSIHPFIHPFIPPPSIYIFSFSIIHLFFHFSIYPIIYVPFFHPSTLPLFLYYIHPSSSLHLSILPSFFPSVYPSFHPSIQPFYLPYSIHSSLHHPSTIFLFPSINPFFQFSIHISTQLTFTLKMSTVHAFLSFFSSFSILPSFIPFFLQFIHSSFFHQSLLSSFIQSSIHPLFFIHKYIHPSISCSSFFHSNFLSSIHLSTLLSFHSSILSFIHSFSFIVIRSFFILKSIHHLSISVRIFSILPSLYHASFCSFFFLFLYFHYFFFSSSVHSFIHPFCLFLLSILTQFLFREFSVYIGHFLHCCVLCSSRCPLASSPKYGCGSSEADACVGMEQLAYYTMTG